MSTFIEGEFHCKSTMMKFDQKSVSHPKRVGGLLPEYLWIDKIGWALPVKVCNEIVTCHRRH
jgi:hypothetical protein